MRMLCRLLTGEAAPCGHGRATKRPLRRAAAPAP